MSLSKEQIEKIKSYESQITTIEDFAEAVRKTVTQYLGYTGNKGFINMIREIFQNSADVMKYGQHLVKRIKNSWLKIMAVVFHMIL